MKALVKVVASLCLAAVCAGFAYAHFTAEPDYVLQEKPFVETVRSGDTIDGILLHYHNEENEGMNYEQWKFNILRLPQNKYLLNEYGGLKHIYPGDKIHIIAKVRVAK